MRSQSFQTIAAAITAGLLTVTPTIASGASTFSPDDFQRHVEKLKPKLPSDDFTILIEPPFIVIGDEPADKLKARSKNTVKWAVDHLKATYFDHDPESIIEIWLFRDKDSYEEHAEKLFGAKPHTPFGYYSPQHKALVMNISTGGGTLVHEIVHPFIAANFPQCPSWFNEGLASLYEQCGEDHGKIKGYVNWRLTGLQQTIKAGRLPSFEDLCGTSTSDFYQRDMGANYGQARYLCYYMQEKGLLKEYYDQFRTNVKRDPTGYKTLQTVLDERDMADFQKRWEAWVLELKRD
jgi:hypothetical protein